jgi:succinoglycan biosynthesis protein ExoA
MEKPSISVVIPTMGRPILNKTLDSLLETEGCEGLEIIVVGPIQDAGTLQHLQDLIQRHAPRVKHLPVFFKYGDASEKRNAGYRESKSDIIAFIDDDVYVPPHWTTRVIEAFAPPDVGMVSGPSLVPTDISRLARLAGLALSSKAAGYVAGRYVKGAEAVKRVKWSRTIGCNMIFRRSAFEQIRGFRPDFYPGEEMMAAVGVQRNRHALVFHSDAYVYHYPKQTFRGFWKQIFRYGATRIRLIRAGLDVELTPLVPGAWVASLVLLGAGAPFFDLCRLLLVVDLALYALADLWMTLSVFAETRRWSDLWLFFINPFMHLSYGVGIWYEIFRPKRDLGDAVGKPTT